MQEYFKELKKDFPGSNLHKYGNFYQLNLRENPKLGCFQISGTKDQVKRSVALLIEKYSLGQK